MKVIALILLPLALLAASACSKKSSSSSHGTTYKGIVLQNICCQDVIRTIGPDYLGQATWTDSNNTSYPVYEHVFKVSNPCQFGAHNIGDTISFAIVSQQVQNCACCMVFVYTPAASYPIQVVN